jgi:cytochrome c-type biogenesis protein CcmH
MTVRLRRLQVALAAAWVVALLAAGPAVAIDPSPPLPDPVLQARYKSLVHEFRCLKCQGETIADTPAPFAADVRRRIRDDLQAGRSDQEIRDFLVDRYGETILLKPTFNAKNAWLWLAPGLFLLLGAFIAARVLRQRRDLLATDLDEPVDDDGVPVEDDRAAPR